MARLVREPAKKQVTWEMSNDSSHDQMREQLEDIDYSIRWLIGIDIGTTQLCIRYKRPGSNEEIDVDGYNGYNPFDGDGCIIPTDLYYPLNSFRPIWGRSIKTQSCRMGTTYDRRRLVRFWKPAIHQTQDDTGYHTDLKAQAMHIFGVPDVSRFARDFIGLVFDFLFHREKGFFYRSEPSFQIEDISIILSKPSGWPQSEYLIFQEAAEAWGLKANISFVSETDALAKSWLRREAGRWEGLKVGFSMVVVDCGGGTVDIDALEISSFDSNKPEKIQVQPSRILASSLRHGCETCLEHFANHIRPRFSNDGHSAEKVEELINSAVFQFSQLKYGFTLDQGNGPWFVDVPGVPNGAIPLEESEFKQLFEPSITATSNEIDDIIEKLKISQGRLPDVIIVGGGGSVFPFFFHSLVERYERRGPSSRISVKRVHDFKKGVAMGAIQLRQDISGFLKYSLSRESYAIPCMIEDVPGADRERMLALYPTSKSKRSSKDGKFYFPVPVLQWFLRKGDAIGPNIVIHPDDDSEVYGVRQAEIKVKENLLFEERLIIYRGHPGPHRWTPNDPQGVERESYRAEYLIVDLRDYITPRELPRMNSKRGDSNRRVRRLDYHYSVEFEGETPNYFVHFQKPGEDKPTKLRVHTSRMKLARLETHKSLSRGNLSSPHNSDLTPVDDDSSGFSLEIDEPTSSSSDISSVQLAHKLRGKQEQRQAAPATMESSTNKNDMSLNRISGRHDVSEIDVSSSILLQHNDSEFQAIEQDLTQKTVSQSISSRYSNTPFLQSCTPSATTRKKLSRVLREDTPGLNKPVLDTSATAVGTKRTGPGLRHAIGDKENLFASASILKPTESLPDVRPVAHFGAPLKIKARTPPIRTIAAPGRRITRQAISEALTAVSPNKLRRQHMFPSRGENETAAFNSGGILKDSLLPIPAKRQKTGGAGSKV